VLRGGAFKPRSSPYSFQGLGVDALKLLREAGDRFKLLRLAAPFALLALLLASASVGEPIYRAALVLQFAFYGLGLLAMAPLKLGPLARIADAAFTFVVLNTAAVVAFGNFVAGRKVAWSR